MHRHGIFHPCRQNLLGRDASPRDFSSLQTKSPRQGCIAPGFFIPADKISSAESSRQGCIAPGFFIPADRISPPGMHRPGIFHPYRQNFPVRDASLQDFSSLQTKSSRQGCIASGFFIPAGKIFSPGMHRPGIFHPYRQNLPARDASPPKLYSRLPGAPAVRRAHLNSPQRLPGAPAPDKADSSDSQTAGFHSR